MNRRRLVFVSIDPWSCKGVQDSGYPVIPLRGGGPNHRSERVCTSYHRGATPASSVFTTTGLRIVRGRV